MHAVNIRDSIMCRKRVECPKAKWMREEICFQVPGIVCKCQEHILCRAPHPSGREEDCVSPSAHHMDNTTLVM